MKPSTLLLIVTSLFLPSLLPAEAEPVEKLKSTIEEVLDVVYSDANADLSAEAKRDKVRSVIESSYDMNVIIRRAIGRNWSLMSEDEQERVMKLIEQLILKAYLDSMNGKDRPEVSYGEAIRISDKRLEIPSTIVSEGNRYEVLYRLGRLKSGWEIYDIVAENISIVSNYRQQFDDHFRKGNGESLIQKLEELLEKETIDEDIQL